jgi:hypothetical protein
LPKKDPYRDAHPLLAAVGIRNFELVSAADPTNALPKLLVPDLSREFDYRPANQVTCVDYTIYNPPQDTGDCYARCI